MNYGLLSGIREIGEYIFGDVRVPFIPYQPDGDWTEYLPKYEPQDEGYSTCCCTVWGTQNQIEILYKRLYGEEPNYSERFNAALLGIRCPGADPQRVYEHIRKEGMIPAEMLRIPDTHAEFLDTSVITKSMKAKGLNWVVKHDFKHEWVWRVPGERDLTVLKQALTTSPIAISVTAWHERDGLYVDNGKPNNHWVVCYKVDDTGIYVFDTYNHSRKKLSLDHSIYMAKRIWLNRRTVSALRKHRSILLSIIERLMKKRTIVDVCTEKLGTDASPSDLAPDELGCAETATTILRELYPQVPVITGTYTLWTYLDNAKNGFERVTVPTPGTIVISPTGTGNGTVVGHTGFFMEDMTIASNDSRTGTFVKNYDLESWHRRYVEAGGFKMYLYRKI